jgi:hypothetical protein
MPRARRLQGLTVMWYARKKGILSMTSGRARRAADERAAFLTASTYHPGKAHGALSDAQLKERPAVARKCPVHC